MNVWSEEVNLCLLTEADAAGAEGRIDVNTVLEAVCAYGDCVDSP